MIPKNHHRDMGDLTWWFSMVIQKLFVCLCVFILFFGEKLKDSSIKNTFFWSWSAMDPMELGRENFQCGHSCERGWPLLWLTWEWNWKSPVAPNQYWTNLLASCKGHLQGNTSAKSANHRNILKPKTSAHLYRKHVKLGTGASIKAGDLL